MVFEILWAAVVLVALFIVVTLFIRSLRRSDRRMRDRDRLVDSIFDEEGKK